MRPIDCPKCGPIREVTEVTLGAIELFDYYIPEDADQYQSLQEDGDAYYEYAKSKTHFICKYCGTKIKFKGYGLGDLEKHLRGH